jgi:hypothetical protein
VLPGRFEAFARKESRYEPKTEKSALFHKFSIIAGIESTGSCDNFLNRALW